MRAGRVASHQQMIAWSLAARPLVPAAPDDRGMCGDHRGASGGIGGPPEGRRNNSLLEYEYPHVISGMECRQAAIVGPSRTSSLAC